MNILLQSVHTKLDAELGYFMNDCIHEPDSQSHWVTRLFRACHMYMHGSDHIANHTVSYMALFVT